MKATSQLHSVVNSETSNISHLSLTEAVSLTPLLGRVSGQGWALPRCFNFRYTLKQKSLLFKIFMDGEISGKKKSPEEAEKIIRKDLKPEEYVTSQQIRSLFSTFAKQLRDGTLKEPEAIAREQNETSEELYDPDPEENNNQHTSMIDIAQEANQVFNAIAEWNVGDYVAVKYETQWFPGKIMMIHDDGALDVSCMKYVDPFNRSNKFRWVGPLEGHEDTITYSKEDILLKIKEPCPDDRSSKRLRYFTLTEEDFYDASDILMLILACK